MDNVKAEPSYPQQSTCADVAENVDFVYDTEDTDSDEDMSKYEFVPRAVVTSPVTKRSHGGRNSLTDWTEHETFALLEAWGERLLKHNRKSVRLEEWYEVADEVTEISKFERTSTQCRNRLDTLKRKYKKEKAMLAESLDYSSNWVYFTKMDMIVTSSLNQANGNCSHATSSGEVKQIVNFEVNVEDRANSSNDMKDSLEGDSEFVKEENENLAEFPPKKTRVRKERGGGDPFKLIADCIDKFSDVYEKVEKGKSKQLVELEKIKMDIKRDLEMERRKILKRGQAEIAKIWGVNIDDDNDNSPRNISG